MMILLGSLLVSIALLLPTSGAASLGTVEEDSAKEHAMFRRNVLDKLTDALPDQAKSFIKKGRDYIKEPVKFITFGAVDVGTEKKK